MRSTSARGALGVLVLIAGMYGGCAMPPDPTETGSVTEAMREACPLLTDEVIEGFLLAIGGLRDNGLSEVDARQQWSDSCENIPPDGNFQGDVEACKACLPTLVEAVYADG